MNITNLFELKYKANKKLLIRRIPEDRVLVVPPVVYVVKVVWFEVSRLSGHIKSLTDGD